MDDRRLVRAGGVAAVAAGLAGAAIGIGLLVVPASVPANDFSYPLSHVWFTVMQIVQALHHAALAFALWALFRAGLAGTARVAAWTAIVPTAGLAVWELIAIAGAGLPYPSDEAAWIDVGYGLFSILSAIGLVLLGVAVVRAGVLSGWSRWIVLAIGCYVFVPMLPALYVGFTAGRVALSVWSLMFCALGVAMVLWSADAVADSTGPESARAALTAP